MYLYFENVTHTRGRRSENYNGKNDKINVSLLGEWVL